MRRVATMVVAVLAVFALATVAASLDTVSTEPADGSDELPPADTSTGPPPGPGTPTDDGGNNTTEQPRQTRVPTTEASTSTSQVPLWQVAVGLGLLLVGSAIALYGLTRGRDDDRPADGGGDEPAPTAPAADSVTLAADVPATNDVYRAWNALCRAAPVESAGRTPADVAAAAVDAGHAADPVTELTDTFCAVRYGDAEPTSERERRARELAAALGLEGES